MEIGAVGEAEQGVEAAAIGKTEGVGEVVFSEVVYKREDQEVLATDHFRRYQNKFRKPQNILTDERTIDDSVPIIKKAVLEDKKSLYRPQRVQFMFIKLLTISFEVVTFKTLWLPHTIQIKNQEHVGIVEHHHIERYPHWRHH